MLHSNTPFPEWRSADSRSAYSLSQHVLYSVFHTHDRYRCCWYRTCNSREQLTDEKNMDLELANKNFIVTGGTDGLGLATAKSLIAEGANVLVSGRTEKKFLSVREELGEQSHKLAFVQGNNSDAELPARLRAATLEQWGQLDGLLVSVGGHPFESVFLGAVRLVRKLSAAMADGGAIALVLAVSAKEAAVDFPISNGLRPGLGLLVKTFAEELGPRKIRINVLLPKHVCHREGQAPAREQTTTNVEYRARTHR